jgi:ribosome-associated protein
MGLFEANGSKTLLSHQDLHHSESRHHSEGGSGADTHRIPKHHYRNVDLPLAAMRAAVDQKGLDVRGLDIGQNSDIADYFVIVSGTSERHVKGIADRIQEALSKLGEKALHVNGYEEGEWVLLDYGNLVVHIFFEPMRQYYGLDELWGKKSSIIEPGPELAHNMRMLRTGIAW